MLSQFLSGILLISSASSALAGATLVPATPNLSPDYFCTWNIQGYVSSYQSGEAQRQPPRPSRQDLQD